LDFTPDGAQVWVTNSGSGETTVFDARSRALVATIATSKDPSGVSISPDGHRAYVTNSAANLLTFVDVATRKILDTLQVRTDPDGVAWSSR
jgi:YVTN family beta-propeller protein